MSAVQQLCNVLVSLGLLTGVCPVAVAAYGDGAEFNKNGGIAKTLETSLDAFMLTNEAAMLNFSLYSEGDSGNPEIDKVGKHITDFCNPGSPSEAAGFVCKAKGTPDDAWLAYGDIKASVLLDPAVYSAPVNAAARAYIQNLAIQVPSTQFKEYITNKSFAEDVGQQRTYAKFLSNQAILGTALYSLNEMYGMRTLGSGMGASGDASSQSMMQVMQTEASRRFVNGDFVAYLNNASTDQKAVLSQIAQMQAFQLWMEYQSYKQNERIEALLAAMVAKTANDALIQTTQVSSYSKR